MKNSETEKSVETACYDDKIRECIDVIIRLCGEERVLDNVLELSEEEEEMFSGKVAELIGILCSLVRAKREKLDCKPYILLLSDAKFWRRVQQEVDRRTNKFLTAVSFNSLEKSDRHKLLQQGFECIFCEKENCEYITDKINDADIAKTIYGVFMESEYAIITAYVSKRRFMVGVADSYGLINDDLEHIWDMFEQNYEAVERHEFHRRNMYLVRTVERISGDVDELKEKMRNIEEWFLLGQKNFEEDIDQ